MIGQPLQPFSAPTAILMNLHLSSFFSSGVPVMLIFYIVFAFWVLYTLVAIYHWLKYSHASWVAIPAILVHLFISFALISYALSS